VAAMVVDQYAREQGSSDKLTHLASGSNKKTYIED
jgi:hypothetical protein